ncbi:MAG: acetyl-CoA carboxylase biotin carboxyl carrier protein [Phycisphaerales bacterium]|nr:acetyl-CoA carboxylase biotin carboxyl carrier protein [Phycisphaerales bacterium]
MIDIRKLKELVRLMVTNDLTELDLRDTEEQVTLRRRRDEESPVVIQAPVAAPAAAPVAAAPAAAPAASPPVTDEASVEDLPSISSPMVGTFFAAANPDSDAFVKVGDEITADTVVCLVEAMKIFNEIKAETSGTIRKVLVSNGESIEFGQPLFLIDPSA